MKKQIRTDKKCCLNCGYVEFDTARRRKDTEYYCTNNHAIHSCEFVTDKDCCPLWVMYTSYTKLLNAV